MHTAHVSSHLRPCTCRCSQDSTDQRQYLARSRWLADLNNERREKNDEYRRQMLRTERYILVEATNDTTISPHASESHGFYEWGSQERIV